MINHEKDYLSNSKDDVLELRQEKERHLQEKMLDDKIKSVKYKIIYTLKPFQAKKLTKQEKKKQRQLLKELVSSKNKSVDLQSLNNMDSLKKILNIKAGMMQLPLQLRNDLIYIIQQQRELLFGGRSRLTKSMTSNSPTNVSMLSNVSPLLKTQNKEKEKKKRKKKVEIEEKLSYEEWCSKIREKLIEKANKEELEETFSNRKDFMSIRVLFHFYIVITSFIIGI